MTSDSGISERVVAEVRRILQAAAKAGSIECVSTRQRGLYCTTGMTLLSGHSLAGLWLDLLRRYASKEVLEILPLWPASNDLLFRTQNLGIEEDELKEHKAIIKDTIEVFIVCVRCLPILS